MNRAVSTWKKLFFKSNISRIRKTIMDYLKAEGTKVELENGLMVVELDECYYCIDFDLDDEYPSNPQLSSSASFLRLNVLSSLN